MFIGLGRFPPVGIHPSNMLLIGILGFFSPKNFLRAYPSAPRTRQESKQWPKLVEKENKEKEKPFSS